MTESPRLGGAIQSATLRVAGLASLRLLASGSRALRALLGMGRGGAGLASLRLLASGSRALRTLEGLVVLGHNRLERRGRDL